MLVLGANARAVDPQPLGRARLFTSIDLAVARLMLRLRDEGVSPVVSRVILATLRESLVEHLAHGDPMALAVHGMRGWLVYGKTRPKDVVAWVLLSDVTRGIEPAIVAASRTTEKASAPAARRSKREHASAGAR